MEASLAAGTFIGIETFATAGLGLARQERMAERIGAGAASLLMAWSGPRALIVGRMDTRLPRFEHACDVLQGEGWPVVVRRSGGSACPVSPGTVQIALCRRVGSGMGIDAQYREVVELIGGCLAGIGLVAEPGERAKAFCPGRYDLGFGARKVAGISQHWRPAEGAMIATTAASVIIDAAPEELCQVVNRFYKLAGGARRCEVAAVTDLRRMVAPGRFAPGALMAAFRAGLRAPG